MDEIPQKPEHKPEVTWGPITSVLVSIGVFFAGQILGFLLFVAGLVVLNRSTFEVVINTLSSTNPGTIYQFFNVLAVVSVTLGLLYSFMRHRGASFRSLGLRNFKWWDILLAAVTYAAYFVLFLIIATVIKGLLPGVDFDQEQKLGFSTAVSGLSLLPIFLSLVILPPLVEEILCRGFLYTGLRTRLSPLVATIITSALFAAAHLQWGGDAPLLWVAAIDTFILSVALCYLRERTGRLWAPIFLHGIKNFIAFAVLFIFKLA